jgi:protein phosphatase
VTAVRTGAVTDVGRVRTNNEDQMLVAQSLFAVADGMGGHAAGEVASQVAVETLKEEFEKNPTAAGLVEATRAANASVLRRAEQDAATRGMGTTVCAAALVPNDEGTADTLVIVNVGDSRAYLLRDGELSQITEDHSVADELQRAGQLTEEQAAVDRRRHVLTRVLGMDVTVTPDRFDLDPFRGDRILLASDGLTNEVSDGEIASILRRIEDPGEAARELVRVAKNNGGADNITVVLVDVIDDDDKSLEASSALANEPTRPRGLITSRERDDRLRELQGDYRPSTVGGPATFEPPERKGRKLRVTLFGLLVVALIAAGGGSYLYFRPWIVGSEDGHVSLIRAGRGPIKAEIIREDKKMVDDLRPEDQRRVRERHAYSSRDKAEAVIRGMSTTSSTSSTTSTTVQLQGGLTSTTTTAKP